MAFVAGLSALAGELPGVDGHGQREVAGDSRVVPEIAVSGLLVGQGEGAGSEGAGAYNGVILKNPPRFI